MLVDVPEPAASAEPAESAEVAEAPARAPSPPPFEYTVPWQMRPLPAPTAVRLDTSFAKYEDAAANGGLTAVTFVSGAVRVPGTGPARAGLDLVGRVGLSADGPPTGHGGVAFSNVQLGLAYAIRLPHDLYANVALGFTVPTGSGGGDDPDPGALGARGHATAARSQLDNPILGSNDASVMPGIGFGWISGGVTLQAEASLSVGRRVRGGSAQREAEKVNSSFGIHAGTFLLPSLSIAGEVRYQRWLDAPFAVDADSTGAAVDTLSLAIGPRLHVDTGAGWIRPGIAYARGLDKPMAAATPNVHVVQVDVPFFF